MADLNNEVETKTVVTKEDDGTLKVLPSDGTASLEAPKKSFNLRKVLPQFKGWLYVLPVIILMAVFTFYPLFRSFIYSFQDNFDRLKEIGGKVGKDGVSIGFDGWGFANFKYVVNYPKFRYCLANTLLFAFISVPVSTLLALFISVFLKSIEKFRSAFQTVFFLPYLTNSLAVGAVFATMFTVIGTKSSVSTYGLINSLFGTKIDWLNISIQPDIDAPSWKQWLDAFFDGQIWHARWVVIIYEIWAGLPFKILILFGALENVSKQYYDAAKVDGASKWTTLWKVTVPLISTLLSYLIITGFIGGFKAYTAVVGIFGREAVSKSYINTVVGYVYDQIGSNKIGRASAASLILFVIILFFTLINLHVSKKRVHY